MKKSIILLIIFILSFQQKNLFGNDLNNKQDSIQAINYYLAGANLINNSLYAESLDSLLVSLDYAKKFYGEDSYLLAGYYYLIAVSYRNIGMLDESIDFSLKSEEYYIKGYGDNYIRLASLYNNLGNAYSQKLNYREALRFFQQGVNIYTNQETPDIYGITNITFNIARVYYQMFEYNEAINIIQNNIDNVDEYTQISYLELLGAIYQETNEFEKAGEVYEKIIQHAKNYYSEKGMGLAVEYINYALFLNNINEFDEAINTLEDAYSIISITEKEKGQNLSEYYKIYATIYEDKNVKSTNINEFKNQKYQNYLKAISYLKKSLEALGFPLNKLLIDKNEEINNVSILACIELLKKIADDYIEIALIFEGNEIEKHKTNLFQSIDFYEVTSNLLQKTKKEFTDDESKILLAGLEQSTYIRLIQASYKAHKLDDSEEYIEKAFQNAELLKSGSLFDKLSNDEAVNLSFIPDSLLEKEQKINSSITSYNELKYYEELEENPDSKEIARLDSILFKLVNQRNELNSYLESNYSQYYNLKYSDNSLKIREIQNNLKSDEILFEYVLNETDTITELYTFLISDSEIQFDRKEFTQKFSENIDYMFSFMSNSSYMFTKNEDSKKFCFVSNSLYQKLIGPYKNKIYEKNLIIIPDGKLSYIAFDALLTELPDTTNTIQFNKLNYLIKSNRVNYSYSANLLYNTKNSKRNASKGILAFAPEYDADSITIGKETYSLRPLLGTQKEVDLIASEIKSEVYKGQDATELKFREECEKFDMLHLAMHAFINDSLPSLSQFAFTQTKDNELISDGLLSVADIYNLKLNARLSVLSACNTGSGQLKKGEGVISLARGFLYAGCPAIVMTLWEVEDNSGTKIMSSFYKFLKKGKTKDEALRLAKLEYLENANSRLAHPHYWLGYVSIGNNAPLFRSYDFYFFGLLLLTILGVIAEQITRIRKARKKRAL